MHVFSSWNIPGTQPILSKKPKENLVLRLTRTFPNPFENWTNLARAKQLLIGLLRGKGGIAPDVMPRVSCI
jgi:hypothetical protein